MATELAQLGDTIDTLDFAIAIRRGENFNISVPMYENLASEPDGAPIIGSPADLSWVASLSCAVETLAGDQRIQPLVCRFLTSSSTNDPAILQVVVDGRSLEQAFLEGNGEAFTVQVLATDGVFRLETILNGVVYIQDAASGGVF